jgi:hypothetical protein
MTVAELDYMALMVQLIAADINAAYPIQANALRNMAEALKKGHQ